MWSWWTELLQDPSRVGIAAASFTGGAALVGVVVSALVSSIVSRRSVYINAVTVERSKWIETLRGTISRLSAVADRVVTLRHADKAEYQDSVDWATDTQELHRLLSDLMLRINPSEPEALNLARAARKLDQAARLHSSAAVTLADEVMIRHAQWVLKAEWERVKQEAAGMLQAPRFLYRRWRRRRAYRRFLGKPGSLHRLDAIGAGKKDLELALLRTEMDDS